MKNFVALPGFLIIINAGFGYAQATCFYQSILLATGLCVYNEACFDATIAAVVAASEVPKVFQTTVPCPDYPCTTYSTFVQAEPYGTIYLASCSSVVDAPLTSQTLAPPTSVTPSLAESTIPSTSNKITSISQASSTTSSSAPTSPSSAITTSPAVTSTGISILPANFSTSYAALPSYTGGDLLRSYCATAQYTLLPGPQSTIVIYVPFIGCVNDKPDCCPYAISTNSSNTSTTITNTNTADSVSTATSLTELPSSSSGSSSTLSNNSPSTSPLNLQSSSSSSFLSSPTTTISTRQLFPEAADEVQQTLKSCPQDYHLVSSSCCPAGYSLATTVVAGITPCYSPLSSTLNITPPPGLTLEQTTALANPNTGSSTGAITSPTTLSTTASATQTSTQVINNVVLSSPFPVQPSSSGSSSISKGQLAAIILSSLGGISVSLSWVFYKKRKGGSAFEKHGYTIAWIAPLEHDALAARNMLDNIHDDVKFPAGKSDDYTYFGGDINGHNVVVATIPSGHSHGVAAMASLARDIKAKFPDVLFGLLVGVASGIPDLSKNPPRDIRLGDVLVAEGENGGACILSYGHGTETAAQAQLNLLAAKTTARLFAAGIGRMKSTSADNWAWFRQYYQALLAKDVKNVTKFRDPGQDKDGPVSTSTTTNAGAIAPAPEDSAARPNDAQIQTISPTAIPQLRPDDERIRVWYGKLGSGDDLRENPQKRQELKDSYDIIGLEIGAASVMDTIDKVGVIRGVCDYGSGQGEDWRPFAAATAAAYAKALLCNIDADTELNKTEAQEAKDAQSEGSGKSPGDATTVDLDVLPTPKLSVNFSLSKLFSFLS